MKIRKKTKENKRAETSEYKKQQSYHYSAKRSNADRLYGRKEYIEDDDTKQSKSRFGRQLAFLPSLVAIVLILLAGFYLLHVSGSVSIKTSSGDPFIGDKNSLQAKADEYMRSSLLNRTKLTFDEAKMQEALANEFPEFSSLSVKTYLFRQNPVVEVGFAEPTLLLTNGSNNFIISDTGIVMADITDNNSDIDTSELLLVQDQTGVDIQLGKVALTSDQVDYIKQITYQTDQKKITTESLILVPGGGELHARYGGLKYFVKYNFYEDARQSSGTFLATKEDLETRGVTPTEYIDVRIPERAYVK